MSTRRKPPEGAELSPIASREELLRLLTWSAKDGSVLAARTLLRELEREAEEPGESVVDQLAARRSQDLARG